MIKAFGHYVITVMTAASLAAAAVCFLDTYKHNRLLSHQLATQHRQLDRLKQQRQALLRKQDLLAEMDRFVNKARDFQLTPEDWAVYTINIQQPMTFSETEALINQCVRSRFAYFKPMSLHLKALPEVQPNPREGTSAGDVTVSVQGQFIARHL